GGLVADCGRDRCARLRPFRGCRAFGSGSDHPVRFHLGFVLPLPERHSSPLLGHWLWFQGADRYRGKHRDLCSVRAARHRRISGGMVTHAASMSVRTPLARVEGLGAAHSGPIRFWQERVSAVALIPLTIWFAYAALHLIGADYETVKHFL